MVPDFELLLRELLDHPQPPPVSSTDERVLDATLRLLGEYGSTRITMDEIATTSGVARATVFRRFGSKDALVQKTYERELRRTLVLFHTATDGAPDPLVTGFVTLTSHACTHPVIQRLSRAEPAALTALWRDGPVPGIEFIRSLLATVAGPDHKGLVDGLARLMFSFTMVPDGVPSKAEMANVVRQLESMRWDGVREQLLA